MRIIGNSGSAKYNLLLIDSNVISEIVHNGKVNSADFFKYAIENKTIVCFSFYNVMEIRNGHYERWGKFLDIFSKYPCAILKPFWQIIIEEIELYNNDSDELYPIFNHFSLLGRDSSYHFKTWIEEVLDLSKDSLKYEQDIFVKTMNYFNRRRDLSEKRVKKEFAKQMKIEKLDPVLAKKSVLDKLYNDDKLPSLRIMFASFYHRYTHLKRDLLISDINDIAINSCTPYMDAIITEKYQSQVLMEILRKMKLSNIKSFKVSAFFADKEFPKI
ncbi:hypothetical protein FYN87_04385 [Listeria monocytogenes]|nr:hypothetical protein [Listeria monocytogenes]